MFSFILFSLASPVDNELLTLKTSINPKRLLRGQEGKVILKLTLKRGIVINPQPSCTINFFPSEEIVFPKDFFTATDLDIEILEKSGEEYLNLDLPIEIPFTVGLNASRGKHTLNGKIKYFVRAENEHWCLKNTTTFSITFYIGLLRPLIPDFDLKIKASKIG